MDRLTLQVERMVHGGRALARDEAGRAALVRGAVPGERVVAHGSARQGVWLGDVVEVLDASEDRVEAPEHPGLDLAHVRYERQLALKAEVVRDAWRRAGSGGRDDDPRLAALTVVPSPARWGYRNAIQPAVVAGAAAAGRRAGDDAGDHADDHADDHDDERAGDHPGGATRSTALGYRRPGTHDVVTLDDDPTAFDALRHAWRAIASVGLPSGVHEAAMRGTDAGEALVALVAQREARDLLDVAHALVEAGVAGVAHAPYDARGRFRGGAQRLAGARNLRQRYGDVVLTITATAFAQPNPAAAGALYRRLAELAPPVRHALDLFAGNGAIAMHLAPRAERVTAIEIDRGSVERGRRDAGAAGLGNVVLVRSDARDVRVPDGVELVSVDPPRAGLAAPVRAAIDASSARTLLYVSCDVATWARDAADFERRGWTLELLEAFDFQPHTHHVELLSRLVRRR